MKRFLLPLLALMLLLPGKVSAAPPFETKVIVAGYSLDVQASPGSICTLTLTLRNTSTRRLAQNIAVSIKPNTAFIPDGQNALFIETLEQNKTIDCFFPLKVSPDATSGAHVIAVNIGYEDGRAMPSTVQTEVVLDCTVPLRLQAETPACPAVNAADPALVKIDVHNLGRSVVYNLSAAAAGDRMELVKTAYGGNLESGESKTLEVTLRLDPSIQEELKKSETWRDVKPGAPAPVAEYPCNVTLSYEDASGQTQSQNLAFTVPVNIPKPEEPQYSLPTQGQAVATRSDLTGWVVAGIALVAVAALVMLLAWKNRKRDDAK